MGWLYWIAVAAGASYWPASHADLPLALLIAWKGAGVALLALWAWRAVPGRDGWLLAAVLGFGALGDVLLEAAGLEIGAAAFLVGHVLAVILYTRHRQRRATAWLALPLVVAAALLLLPDAGVGIYATALGAMACAATASRFALATIGAWLFVASDLLIFAQQGAAAGAPLLIWPLYFAGQALIAAGVARGLSSR